MKQLFSAQDIRNPFNERQYADQINQWQWLIIGLLLVITVVNVHESMLRNVAFDAMPYLKNYVGKFKTEGRWINFILFDFLRVIPKLVAVPLNTLFLFIFGYKVATLARQERWLAIVFALLMVNVPQFTMLFKWPMTLVPGTLALALLAYGIRRFSMPTFMMLAGIVLFATYPAFYFVVPLLFIHQIGRMTYLQLVKFVVIWMVGYVVGYAVAQVSVYFYTSIWSDHAQFIELARWRAPHPITDLSSVIANAAKSLGNLFDNVEFFAQLGWWLLVPITAVGIWAFATNTKVAIVLIMVVFSLYASVIPVGVSVPLRSGITLPLALMALVLLIPLPWARLFVLISLFIPYSYQMHEFNREYNGERILIANMLEANDPNGYLKQSDNFKQIMITMDDVKVSQFFYDQTQWPMLRHTGYLRSHYIKAYLYEFGWTNDRIQHTTVDDDQVKGEAWVTVDKDTIYLRVN